MTDDGFRTYMMYLALQRHFSSNYDFFQYNGKVRVQRRAYENRSDMYAFEKLAKIIKAEDRLYFFVAHFIENPKEWIKNMSKSKFDEFNAKYKNLPARFRNDMELIKMKGPSRVLSVDQTEIPLIHKMVLSEDIAAETVVLLDRIFPFMEKHKAEVTVPFVWEEYVIKMKNYSPFVNLRVGNSITTYTDIARDVLL